MPAHTQTSTLLSFCLTPTTFVVKPRDTCISDMTLLWYPLKILKMVFWLVKKSIIDELEGSLSSVSWNGLNKTKIYGIGKCNISTIKTVWTNYVMHCTSLIWEWVFCLAMNKIKERQQRYCFIKKQADLTSLDV